LKASVAAVVSFCGALAVSTAAYAQPQIVLPPPPWQWTDIGAVGIPGEVHLAPNTEWNVSGAGSDIWGIADSFFYVYQPFRDGSISNTFLSETFTDPFAKAGLMIRQSLDPGSPEVIVDVKPDGGIEFMTRAAQGGVTTFIAGASVPVFTGVDGSIEVNATLLLTRSGNTVTGAYCPSNTCIQLGSVPFPAGDAFVGEAVTSHSASTINHVFSGSGPAVSSVPFGWQAFDIGAVTAPGHSTYENATGTFFVSGDGSDIWGSADSFSAVTRGGIVELTARVVSEQNTDPFAKAGLIMGELAANARRVILDVKPDGGLEFMARTDDGGSMSFIAGASASFPVWLKLTLSGSVYTGEMSADGATWTTVGAVTMATPSTRVTGLAVTSHDPGTLNTAQFDNVGFAMPPPAGQNLLVNGGFEDSVVPGVSPGWVSDRGTPAASETALPLTGAQNGACRTTSLDCGIYQEVISPGADTNFSFTINVRADHPGALIGANLNGQLYMSRAVEVGGYQTYGIGLFTPNAGDVLRIWMYAPAVAGFVAIDDAALVITSPIPTSAAGP
jgi:hypothetical protein